MSNQIDPDELHVNFVKEGYYIDWIGEADEVVVFTPGSDHIATLKRTPEGWKPTEAPMSGPNPDLDVLLDGESEIRAWAARV